MGFFLNRNLPLTIFVVVWSLALFLYFLNPYYYDSISFTNQTVIYLSLFCTILGFILATLIFRKDVSIVIHPHQLIIKNHYVFNTGTILSIMKVTFIFIMLGLIIELSVLNEIAGGLVNYFSNPISARYLYVEAVSKVVSGWNIIHSLSNYLIDFTYFAAILGSIIFVLDKKKYLVAIFPLVIAFIVSFITFQRFFFVQCFGLWFFGIITISNVVDPQVQKSALRKVKIIALGILFLFVIFSFILLRVRLDFQKEGIRVKNVGELIVETNYAYLAGNPVAFSNFLDRKDTELYYGGSSLRHIYKWFARFGFMDENEIIMGNYPFMSIGRMSINTFTYMRIFYEDFGQLGLYILSFLWGFLGNILYLALAQSFSLWKYYLVLTFIYSYFLSFYSLTLISITLIFFILCLILFFEYIVFRPHNIYKLIS